MDASEPLIKVLLIGEFSVGKSCLFIRYAENKFPQPFPPTVGIDFRNRRLVLDDQAVCLQVWDSAGPQKFRTITKASFRGAHGILLIFDVSNSDTFGKCQTWINSVHEKTSGPVEIILVGNKCDKDRQVSTEDAQAFADQYNVRYFETSAKTGMNVEETFLAIAGMVVSNKSIVIKGKESEVLPAGPPAQQKKGSCC
jgi:small GTP-binding protein